MKGMSGVEGHHGHLCVLRLSDVVNECRHFRKKVTFSVCLGNHGSIINECPNREIFV